MSVPQNSHSESLRVSINGCLVDEERWDARKAEAARLVAKRLLTVAEASEHFGLPAEEIEVGLQPA